MINAPPATGSGMMRTMKLKLRSLGLLLFISFAGASPATKPVAGLDTSIASDQYHFPAPPSSEWKAVKPDPAAESISFIDSRQDGQMVVALLNKDASVDPDIAQQVAVAIIKKLKEMHTQQHQLLVMPPKMEKDKRFAIVIHEKYKVGQHIADQLHIYRSVGPRVVMLTVNSVSDDPVRTMQLLKDGKDLLAAITFNRKAFKKTG